jgi:hypothetical protein
MSTEVLLHAPAAGSGLTSSIYVIASGELSRFADLVDEARYAKGSCRRRSLGRS